MLEKKLYQSKLIEGHFILLPVTGGKASLRRWGQVTLTVSTGYQNGGFPSMVRWTGLEFRVCADLEGISTDSGNKTRNEQGQIISALRSMIGCREEQLRTEPWGAWALRMTEEKKRLSWKSQGWQQLGGSPVTWEPAGSCALLDCTHSKMWWCRKSSGIYKQNKHKQNSWSRWTHSASGKVIGYKGNTQKSLICLYDSNEQLETKFKAHLVALKNKMHNHKCNKKYTQCAEN